MITFDRFPDGKQFCVTFSYDDGPSEDIRLAKLFNKYNLKATFNINDSFFKSNDVSSLKTLYAGHEIACHGRYHIALNEQSDTTIINEVFEQRKMLEGYLGEPVCGMAYAYGLYDEKAIEVLKKCGIVYSRTTGSGNMRLPEDFMKWHPTCHHKYGIEKATAFLKSIGGHLVGSRVLYIWGHAFELRTEDDWAMMEELCALISNNDKIWYATNIEIYRYTMAVKRLVISANEDIVYNPSNIDVWVSHHRQPVKIPAGQTVKL